MNVIDLRRDPFDRWENALDRRYAPAPELAASVAGILAEIRRDGDAALSRFSARFDHVDLARTGLMATEAEIRSAMGHLDPQVKEAFEAAAANVREFALRSRRTDWSAENFQGAMVGERFDPFQRVGIYIPAGTAPLVSSAIMNVCLAATAGIPEIVVTSPPNREGTIDRNLLAALSMAGATEIYKVGGAQAIGALAFGTQSIRRVVKVFGPGNAYVTEAKRQVFGYVSVDLLPGPSEILVLADHTANLEFVAADLLAQAEHGPGSVICLVTTDESVAVTLPGVIERQLGWLHRQTFLQQVLKEHASIVIARDRMQAVRVANAFAPEHLSLMMENSSELADEIVTAGAIFIGHFSPVVAGDFMAGPSHTLPTGGAARSFGGLTVDQFQRRTSLVAYDREALKKSAEILRRFSAVEQLDAHGRSVAIRFET